VLSLAFYDFYRFTVFHQGHIDLYLRYILLGFCATLTTQAFLYPLDTVRRLVQADSSLVVPRLLYKNAKSCFVHFSKSNPRLLYRGFFLNAWKTPLQTALTLVGYEYTRNAFEDFLRLD
jgi:hypothetical protein